MVFDISKISGIGDFTVKKEKRAENSQNSQNSQKTQKTRELYYNGEKVFLVVNKNTIEVRTDDELRKLLVEKYESVMESRYFGRGGIEIVLAGQQLGEEEIVDLIRLSYNLS